MATHIIGREKERLILDNILLSKQAEFAVVYGRRRVGKTFLIRQHLGGKLVFDFSGAFKVEMDLQIDNFFNDYIRTTSAKREVIAPNSWQEVFNYIYRYLKSLRRKSKIVVFIDEFPWFNTPRSGFLKAF